jgi:hypothetical protein
MQKSPRLLAQELDAINTAGVHSLGSAGEQLNGPACSRSKVVLTRKLLRPTGLSRLKALLAAVEDLVHQQHILYPPLELGVLGPQLLRLCAQLHTSPGHYQNRITNGRQTQLLSEPLLVALRCLASFPASTISMTSPTLQLCLPAIAQSSAACLAQTVLGAQPTAMGSGLDACSTEVLEDMLQLAMVNIRKMTAPGAPALAGALQVGCYMSAI